MISISIPKCYQGIGAQSDVTTPTKLEDAFKLNTAAQILVTFLEVYLDYSIDPFQRKYSNPEGKLSIRCFGHFAWLIRILFLFSVRGFHLYI